MITKTDKQQYYFEVQLNWQHDDKGILTARDVKDTIHVATPAAFAGGTPDMWTPEHLFLSALSSCFMSTYMALAVQSPLAIAHFECSAIGQVHVAEGHVEFTKVDLFPKIFVTQEATMPLANELLIKAYQHSIVANSIKAALIQHGQVLLEKKHHAY